MKKILTKKIIIPIVILLLVGGVAYALLHKGSDQAGKKSPVNTINYNPPTSDEKSAGNEQKTENEARNETIKNTTPNTTADIVLVDANQYFDIVEVRAYISNIYEDGGTCKATFTQNGQTVSATSSAHKDATTTQCSTIDIPRSKFPNTGTWQLIVSYSSPSASGQTIQQNVSLK